MTHICVSKLNIIGSDNGLSPGRRQAIIWTNAGILLIEPLGTNFSEILSQIHPFSFKKIHLKMSSGKWRPFCLGLNVLKEFIAFVIIIEGVITLGALAIHMILAKYKCGTTPFLLYASNKLDTFYNYLSIFGCTVEVWEWISNFIQDFIMDVITYPCWDLS